MFDKQAFHSLSYGMYVIGARLRWQGLRLRCQHVCPGHFISLAGQRGAEQGERYHRAAVRQAGCFTASCLSEQADMQLIGTFGFHTSTELDKFAQHASARDEAGYALCGGAMLRVVFCEGGLRT